FLGPDAPSTAVPLDAAWNDDAGDRAAALAAAGYAGGDDIEQRLRALREHIERYPPGAQGMRRLDQLVPRLLAVAARQDNPAQVATRMLRIVEAVLGRTTYLALLLENPRALDQLARVAAASEWITQLVARHPLLLDELIDPRLFEDAPTRHALQEDLETMIARCAPGDLEALMDALRVFQ